MVANGSPGSADLTLLIGQGPDTFPFRRALSLRPLIEFWQGDGTACEGTICAALGSVVSEAVALLPLKVPLTVWAPVTVAVQLAPVHEPSGEMLNAVLEVTSPRLLLN